MILENKSLFLRAEFEIHNIMIKITFPDGSVREYNEGVTGLQIAESISSRLAQEVLACGVNGETYDLGRPIQHDADLSSSVSVRPSKMASTMMSIRVKLRFGRPIFLL